MLLFLLVFAAKIDLLFFPLFFSSRGARGHAAVVVNDFFFYGFSFFFFDSEESIWSGITNPFLDSPKKCTDNYFEVAALIRALICNFWSQMLRLFKEINKLFIYLFITYLFYFVCLSGVVVRRQASIWFVISKKPQQEVRTAGWYQTLSTYKAVYPWQFMWNLLQGNAICNHYLSVNNPSTYIITRQTA